MLALLLRCARNNCCSGCVGSCVTIPFLSRSYSQRLPPIPAPEKDLGEETCRQMVSTGRFRSPAADVSDTCVQKLIPRYDTGFNSCSSYVERSPKDCCICLNKSF
ncbi:hypothetical protein AVEN_3010-1 [Araneus ventricosus]|uniref:Uncharacterized protein n=1 Tax=Araneus ventricosus TaxID=182803 RepID=A0A4Y2J6H4_ARAVE|nr:hypothetical protein AVEN_3010-1 [Araneus ventricosus]